MAVALTPFDGNAFDLVQRLPVFGNGFRIGCRQVDERRGVAWDFDRLPERLRRIVPFAADQSVRRFERDAGAADVADDLRVDHNLFIADRSRSLRQSSQSVE